MSTRQTFETALKKYVSDTFEDIQTIKSFIKNSDNWDRARKGEIKTLQEMECNHEDNCVKLRSILKGIRHGLEDAEEFLNSLEELSVTSVHVFRDNPNFRLTGIPDQELVYLSILMARLSSPKLIQFKQSKIVFNVEKCENLDILLIHLNNYTEMVQDICDGCRDSYLPEVSSNQAGVEVTGNPSETTLGKMLDHITMLDFVRMNGDFRMMSLFCGEERPFMTEFPKLKSEMLAFLDIMKDCAQQIVSTNIATNATGVALSTVGIAAGLLSFFGIIFAPFSFGASLGLVAVGATVGAASVANAVSEMVINKNQAAKAQENFKKFIEHADRIQTYLDDALRNYTIKFNEKDFVYGSKISIKSAREPEFLAKAVQLIKNRPTCTAGELTARAVGGGLLQSGRVAKAISGAASFLFIGVDVTFLVLHGISLHNKGETQTSKWITAREKVWRGQVATWDDMCETLKNGQLTYQTDKNYLDTAFQF